MPNQAFNADSLQRGICFANFTPRCKSLRRQAGSVLPVNLALGVKVVLLTQQASRLLADLAALKAHSALRYLCPQSAPCAAHKWQPVGGSLARRVSIAYPRPACCRVHHHRKKHGSLFHLSVSTPNKSFNPKPLRGSG